MDTGTVARFLREARAAVRMKGEHVTRVLDVASLPSGLPYIVMEHLEGADLASVVETKGWLPISLAVDYVLQTCEALAEAHALGIVHRDIKPSNLFLTTRADGSPCIKVLDFGISKAMATPDGRAPELNLTQTQAILGSPQYMAPEQMRSSKRVDGRTDIWAIGATLHELLTGAPPFEAKSMPELFAMILEDAPPRLCERRPDVPPALEAVVARCLQKDPGKRFADVHELARALAPLGSLTSAGVVERIGRVGFNAARSSERLPLQDVGSAPGMDLSRTEKTEPAVPMKKERPKLLIAGAVVLMVLIGGASIAVGVQRVRASRPVPAPTQVTSPPAESEIPAARVDAPPTVASSASGVPEVPPMTEPAPAASATTAATTTAKTPEVPRPKPPPGPHQHAQNVPSPSATTTAAAQPTATTAPTTTAPPRAPGVASSRYD